MQRPFSILATVGLLAWCLCVAGCELDRTAALLLLGPLVAVPLGLSIERSAGGRSRGAWRLVAILGLPAALLLALSFAFLPGAVAGALAAPWLLVTFAIAGLGVWRFAERGGGPAEELAIDAGHVFLAVGGVWTFASRAGTGLLGFQEPWVVLTGAHFHFAGFALPILTGLVGRVRPGRLAATAALGVILGVPLVAIGITLGAEGVRRVELFAALWLAVAALLVAWLHVAAWRRAWLAPIAGLALAFGMALVVLYAVGTFRGTPWVTLQFMVDWHATANVVGFALPMLGWWAWRGAPAARAPGFQLLVPALGDLPELEVWEARPIHPATEAGPRPSDPRDRHEIVVAADRAAATRRDAATAIAAYAVFPGSVGEACVRRTPVQVGDTLLLVYRLPFGLRAVFGARVSRVFDGDGRAGFTYRTVAGHPFAGEEDFVVEDGADGTVVVALRAWSRPATLAMRIAYPLVRRLQVAGGRAAAVHLARSTPAPGVASEPIVDGITAGSRTTPPGSA